jgi:hypothetical protein
MENAPDAMLAPRRLPRGESASIRVAARGTRGATVGSHEATERVSMDVTGRTSER